MAKDNNADACYGRKWVYRAALGGSSSAGHRVRILDLRPPMCDLEGAQFLKGSVLDPAKVREAVTNVEEVYHLAALPGMWVPRMQDFHTVTAFPG